MTFCFFSLFSDFWSTAILHISSGLKNASWLFKRRRKNKMQKQQQQKNPRNHGLGNLSSAPPLVPCSLELIGQVLPAVLILCRPGPPPFSLLPTGLEQRSNSSLCSRLGGAGLQFLSTILTTLLWGNLVGDFMLLI